MARTVLLAAALALASIPTHAASPPENKATDAETTPVAAPSTSQAPKTAHDPSSYRFNMTQNGRRMTAAEFDAWMKARGIRVATGRPAPAAKDAAPATATAAATATVPACQPTASVTC